MIAHQAEIDRLFGGFVDEGATSTTREYLVLGTLDNLSGSVTVEEVINRMADFKDYMRIDYTPGGWHRSSTATDR